MSALNDPSLSRAVERYQRQRARLPYFTAILMLILAAGTAWYIGYDSERGLGRFEANAGRIDALEEANASLKTNYGALYEQFQKCSEVKDDPDCKEPVAPPVREADEPTSPIVLRQTLSPGQIKSAVASFCGDTGDCEGQPTTSQVLEAVSRYCEPRGDCTPAPIQPSPGPQGAQGPAGRAPTAEEIDAAVARFCSGDRCRGKDAPTIESIDCEGIGFGRITLLLSDGSSVSAECDSAPETGE